MTVAPPPPGEADYDEFGFLHENAAEVGVPFDPADPPVVRRTHVPVPSGGTISALVWGDAPPELAFLHGGAQNAHTWDSTVLALGRPLVAIDLPGHGHSTWRPERDYGPRAVAGDVAAALAALAPEATTLVGMSLGGLTAIAVLDEDPDRARRLALVDITPGVDRRKAGAVLAFVAGPQVFPSFDAILERTIAHNPTRSRASLERGVRHNARPNPDGTWSWRYDRPSADSATPTTRLGDGVGSLWATLGALDHDLLLARGTASPVVAEEDLARLREVRADAEVIDVDGAGHSIQGDRPVELARVLDAFHARAAGRGDGGAARPG
jgi:pimeloyl-ACP methyl ester carboxylesterase